MSVAADRWRAVRDQPWQARLGIAALLLAALTAVTDLPQPLQSSTAAAAALLALLAMGGRPWRELRQHPLPWLILLMALYSLVHAAVVAQPLPGQGYARQLTLDADPLKVLVYALAFGWWLARYPRWILPVLKLLALGWALWLLVQMPWAQVDALAAATLRLRLGYAENLTGAFAALVLLIALHGAWLCCRGPQEVPLRGLRGDGWVLLSLAALLVLLFAQSRGAWLAAAVGTVLLVTMGRAPAAAATRPVPAGWRRLLPGFAVLLLVPVLGWYLARPAVLQRFDGGTVAALTVLQGGPVSAAAPSVGLRLELWRFALDEIARRPLFGWGLASIHPQLVAHGIEWQGYVPPHLHDTPLQVAMGMGLLGLLLVAAAFLLPLRDVWRAWRRASRRRGVLALILALGAVLLVVNLFDYLSWSNGYMRGPLEIVLGCAVAVSLRMRRGEPEPA